MSLTIKAFLYEQSWRGDPKEIRRFSVDQDVSTSYAYLLEKLAQVFPSVQAGSVAVAWMGKWTKFANLLLSASKYGSCFVHAISNSDRLFFVFYRQ
jgi:hypothetical protein